MPLYLLELHPVFWSKRADAVRAIPAPATHGWRFFAQCQEDDPLTCDLLYSDPADFTKRGFQDFQRLLEFLYEAGKSGTPWRDVFKSGNQYHRVHTVDVPRLGPGGIVKKSVEVLQFKKTKTDIRLLNIQSGLGSCNLFISHAFEKDSAKTPSAEQRRAEENVIRFFDALDNRQLQLISMQGGKDATPRFE
jgi:hypothetical protein